MTSRWPGVNRQKPSWRPRMEALLLARKGNFPILTLRPFARACASVKPTLPMPGSVNVTPGMRLRFTGVAGLPAMWAMATMPSRVPFGRVDSRSGRLTGKPQRNCPTFGLAMSVLPNPEWGALSPWSPLRRYRLGLPLLPGALEEAREGIAAASDGFGDRHEACRVVDVRRKDQPQEVAQRRF